MLFKLVPATALATLALAAPAAAQSIALTTAFDPVEDVPFLVTATGVGAKHYNVYATIKPVGSVGCGTTFETDPDGGGVMRGKDAEGAYTVTDTAHAPNPGQYLLCAWMQEYSFDSVAIATTSALVNVRSAQSTLTIGGPTYLRPGTTANFTFTGTTEIERQVVATVKRDGGRPCGSSSSVDDGDALIYGDHVQGNYTAFEAPSTWEIDDRGTYRICAWIQEGSGDTAPEAAATYTFTVGTHPRCANARNRVTNARRAVRSAKRFGTRTKLRKARRELSRAQRAARRAC